jgi:hypothetical protein
MLFFPFVSLSRLVQSGPSNRALNQIMKVYNVRSDIFTLRFVYNYIRSESPTDHITETTEGRSRATFVCMVLCVLAQLSGSYNVYAYVFDCFFLQFPYPQSEDKWILLYCISLLCSLFSCLVINLLGQKRTLQCGQLGVTIMLPIFAYLTTIDDPNILHLTILFTAYVFCFNTSLGSISFMHCLEVCTPSGVGYSLATIWLSCILVILAPFDSAISFSLFFFVSLPGLIFTSFIYRSTKYVYNYQTKEKSLLTPKDKRMLYGGEL